MEFDQYQPGNIIYTDRHSLVTSDGQTSEIVAGNRVSSGYREGQYTDARFDDIKGFIQLSSRFIVAVDYSNHCLKMIKRKQGQARVDSFSGACKKSGFKNGKNGTMNRPQAIIRDSVRPNQLLLLDTWNDAIRTVAVSDGSLGTFVESEKLDRVKSLTQNQNGDIFISTYEALISVTYSEKKIYLVAGIPGIRGHLDSTLLKSEFRYPTDLLFIGPSTLMVADNKIRLLDLQMDKVTTLNICSGCKRLTSPSLLLMNNHSLYIGDFSGIQGFRRKSLHVFQS